MPSRYLYIYYNKIITNVNFDFVTSVGLQFNAPQRQIESLTLQLSVPTNIINHLHFRCLLRIYGECLVCRYKNHWSILLLVVLLLLTCYVWP